MKDAPGIYRIVNTLTNRTYFGSSTRVIERLKKHRWLLEKNKHFSPRMQRTWNKYGSKVFTFEQIISKDSCDQNTLTELEQRFIDAYLDHGMPLYNQQPSALSKHGFKYRHTIEAKDKISLWHKGRKLSVEHVEAIRNKNIGLKRSAEFCERMSKANTGKHHSPESRKKMSESQKVRFSDPEARRTCATMSGKKHTDETKLKMSLSGKGRKQHPDHIKNASLARTGMKRSEESKKKMSAVKLGRPWSNKRRMAYITSVTERDIIMGQEVAVVKTVNQLLSDNSGQLAKLLPRVITPQRFASCPELSERS